MHSTLWPKRFERFDVHLRSDLFTSPQIMRPCHPIPSPLLPLTPPPPSPPAPSHPRKSCVSDSCDTVVGVCADMERPITAVTWQVSTGTGLPCELYFPVFFVFFLLTAPTTNPLGSDQQAHTVNVTKCMWMLFFFFLKAMRSILKIIFSGLSCIICHLS